MDSEPLDQLSTSTESSPATSPANSSNTTIPSTNAPGSQGKESDLLSEKNEEALKAPISPGIQQKLDVFSQKYDKRKSEFSPESAISKKEKKRMKELEKASRKQIAQEKRVIQISN